ncbi:hypothetical protein EU97_0687 [Prochlorococcus marinus str. MIT 9311]|nr:hypothetical protein EU97_0687 [Prochlorococcus marinus str. MIT 9311]
MNIDLRKIFLQNFVFTLIYFKAFATINKLKSKYKKIDHI